MVQKHLDFVPPMIGGEGGWLYQNADDKTMPPVDDEKWTAWHYEMFDWFRAGILSNGDALPDYLFSVCPWLLYASNWYSDSWVNGLDADKKQKLIDKLANDEPFVRQFGARTATPAQPEEPVRVEPEQPQEQPREEPTEPTAETYTIQGGDTLSAIARKFSVSVAALVAANHIENPSLIRPGQILKIPRA